MNLLKTIFQIMALVVVSLSIGCQTPKAITDLSNQTAANSSRLGTEIKKHSALQKKLTEERADLIAEASLDAANLRARIEADLDALRFSKQTNAVFVYTQLVTGAEKSEQAYIKRLADNAEQKQQLLKAQETVGNISKTLEEISKALTEMTKKGSDKEQFERFKSYVKAVVETYDKIEAEKKKK